MRRSRLAKLSYTQLLDIAADACESSPELKNKADALIAEISPLPSWCVDILLSPDLLPQLFSSLGLSEHAAAGVCTTWSHAYSRQLRRCRYVNPRSGQQLADVPITPTGLCMLPGGVLAIASVENRGQASVKFVAARNGSDPQALAACRASSLAARRFVWLEGLALSSDGLLVCSSDNGDRSAALYKFAKDGSMDELATVPALTNYERGFKQIAVHQQTQRTYGLAQAGDDEGRNALVLLDANVQVIATIEAVEATDDYHEPIIDIAVHGEQVIILTSSSHPKGSGLRLLDLDGRFLRTIAAAEFRNPQAIAASHGRAFVIDDDDDNEQGTVLHVVDIQSGDIFQSVPLPLGLGGHDNGTIIVEDDEIYIVDFRFNKGIVLRIAGSEA